ncbi:hypothetical protein DQ04_05671010 [Trypanosoma grayi]|uniref:hypothetical protein n=1 Tax=Trypanosoma grayi TaxID=71804 RepID=UPI0004F405BC|nr:hypothetical protein DQ04_05671010 [Trypanosoma grayi]KEG09177.1 hypothetical protein DQ04_05671010 [Trypanosoma grayi]
MEQKYIASGATLMAASGVKPEYRPEVSSVLVVSLVAVRGLVESLCDVPLALELVVGGCSFMTETLLPLAMERGEAVVERNHMCPRRPPRLTSRRVLGLDPLRIVVPVLEDSACLLQDGVRVGLRTADGAVLLGTGCCGYTGDWFPLSPCGGEVQLTFKVYNQKNGGVTRASASGQLFLDGVAKMTELPRADTTAADGFLPMPVAKNGGARCSQSWPLTNAKRLAHSAGTTPKSHPVNCKKRSAADDTVLLDMQSITSRHHVAMRPDDAGRSGSIASDLTPEVHRHMLSGMITADENHTATGSNSCSFSKARRRECQPRSLVYSHIRVSGFLPLSPHGRWRLEFTWPHPQVSLMKRTIWIPPNVDANGAAAVRETLSVELPLFVRGEVQTYVHAVWSGSSGDDPRTHLHMQVDFDPIIVDVQDCEINREEQRRHGPMLADALPLTVSDLSVQLMVKLEFYEPQRDGHSGRPTSAFPHRRNNPTPDDDDDDEDKDEDEDEQPLLQGKQEKQKKQAQLTTKGSHEVPAAQQGTTLSLPSLSSPSTPQRIDARRDTQPGGNNVGVTRSNRCTEMPRSSSCSMPKEVRATSSEPCLRHNTTTQTAGLVPCNRQLQLQSQAQPQNGIRRWSPRRLATNRARRSCNVQDFVPCYSEQQRKAVFKMYDTEGRGYITQEQLLHFCHAHVALFDSGLSDASILRGLGPYVPYLGRHQSTAFSSTSLDPRKRCSTAPIDGKNARRTSIYGSDSLQSQSLSLTSPTTRSEAVSARTAPVTGAGTSMFGYEAESITYRVFEVIALRLASM